ncbi:MAG: DUF898 family protein [Spirochaetales bacterium]|nr:DUF898 family protein [Spirochaetales bacterium]
MKNYFKADIQGRGFFKTYIPFLILIVVLTILTTNNDEATLRSSFFSFAESYVSILLSFSFFCYAVKSVFFKDEGFLFSGRLGEFAPKVLLWLFLTVITLGIYSPWYVRNIVSFYLERFGYKQQSAEFLSRPGTLLKYMLLTLYLPLIILMAIMAFFLYRSSGNYYPDSAYGFAAVTIIIIFLVMIPFIYFYFTWIVNVKFAGYKINFTRNLAETTGFLVGQILLSIITIFIYYPAACVKIYRFVADGSSITTEDGVASGTFGFDGMAGKGFGLLWGQGLLTIITVGIYGPWAMSKVTNWFINNTFIEGDINVGQQ